MTLKTRLSHPISELAGFLGSFAVFLEPTTLLGLVAFAWQSAGTLFTATSIAAFTVAPNVSALTPYVGVLQGLALGAAILFLVKLGSRAKQNLESNI